MPKYGRRNGEGPLYFFSLLDPPKKNKPNKQEKNCALNFFNYLKLQEICREKIKIP